MSTILLSTLLVHSVATVVFALGAALVACLPQRR
jgi:hypothetical protein